MTILKQEYLTAIDKSIKELRDLLNETEDEQETKRISEIIARDLEFRRMVLLGKYDDLSAKQKEYLDSIKRSFS
ncbi:MAG: hypothetical protein AB8G05_19685 [Oligoflexales bacterium]